MKDKLFEKLFELEKERDKYLEMLDVITCFDEKYLLRQLHDIRVQINLLEEILEEC